MVIVSLKSLKKITNRNDCYIGLDAVGNDPSELPNKAIPFDTATNTCMYETSKINQDIQLDTLRGLLVNPNDIELVLQSYCAYETDKGCPAILGNRCSRLSASGNECSRWFSQQPPNIQDQVVKEYCNRFPKYKDCRCMDRGTDPVYQQVKKQNLFNDGCWYSYCASSDNLKTSDINTVNCPQNICQTIYSLNSANDVLIKDNEHKITCDFTAIKNELDQNESTSTSTSSSTSSSKVINQILTYSIPLVLIASLFSAITVYIIQEVRSRRKRR
jgi:hypothetical protein